MTHWRASLLDTGVQSRRGFLKGKVETPSSAMHSTFLPYKAPMYTNTSAHPAVHPHRPMKPSWALCARMETSCHFHLYFCTKRRHSRVISLFWCFHWWESVRCRHDGMCRLVIWDFSEDFTGFRTSMAFVALWINSFVRGEFDGFTAVLKQSTGRIAAVVLRLYRTRLVMIRGEDVERKGERLLHADQMTASVKKA